MHRRERAAWITIYLAIATKFLRLIDAGIDWLIGTGLRIK